MRTTTEGAMPLPLSRELVIAIEENDHDRSSPTTVITSSPTKRARKPTNRYLPPAPSCKKTPATKTAPTAITTVKATTKKRHPASTNKKQTHLVRGRTQKKASQQTRQQQQQQELPFIQAADSELRAIVIGLGFSSKATNSVKTTQANRPTMAVAITTADYHYNNPQNKKLPKVSLSPVTGSREDEPASPSSLPSHRMLHSPLMTNNAKRPAKRMTSTHQKRVSMTPKQTQKRPANVSTNQTGKDAASSISLALKQKQKRPKKRQSLLSEQPIVSVLECLPNNSSSSPAIAVVPKVATTSKKKKRRLFGNRTPLGGNEPTIDHTEDHNNDDTNIEQAPPQKKARKSRSDKGVKRGSRGTSEVVVSSSNKETNKQQRDTNATLVTLDHGPTLANTNGIITNVTKSDNNSAAKKKPKPANSSLVMNVTAIEMDDHHPHCYVQAHPPVDIIGRYPTGKLLEADNQYSWTRKNVLSQAPISPKGNVVTDIISIEMACHHPHYLRNPRVGVRTMDAPPPIEPIITGPVTLVNRPAATRKSPNPKRVQRDHQRAIKAIVAAAAANIASVAESSDEECVACHRPTKESDEDYAYIHDDDDFDEDIFDSTEKTTTATSNNAATKSPHNKGSVEGNALRLEKHEAQVVSVGGGKEPKKKRKPRSDKGVKRASRKSKEHGNDAAPAPEGNQAESNSSSDDTMVKSTTTTATTKPRRKPRADKGMKRGEYKKQKMLNTTTKGGNVEDRAPSHPPAPKGYYDGVQCGNCLGCRVIQNCGKCIPCLDMPEFGGPGATNKRCILKKCHFRKARQSRAEKAAEKANNKKEDGKDKIYHNNEKADPRQQEMPKIHLGFGIQDAHNSSDLESLCDYEDSVAGDISDMEMDASDSLVDMVLPGLKTARGTYAATMGAKGYHSTTMSIKAVGAKKTAPEPSATDMQEEREATISPPPTNADKSVPSAADLARQMQEQQRVEMMQLQEEAGEDSDSEDDDDENDDFFLPPPPLPVQYY